MVTVIVNLAPARSTFHIAGQKEAEYKEPGDAVVLPSAVWHRSGVAQRRTVKVAYFFKLMKKDEFDARTGEPPKADKDTPIAVEPAPGSADPATGSSSAADEERKEEDAEVKTMRPTKPSGTRLLTPPAIETEAGTASDGWLED